VPTVEESSFRYPGPGPQTREIGLLMLADAIEATARSMDKPTPQKIEGLVDDTIRRKIQDGQLSESGLTLNEIQAARDSFCSMLKSMLHSRISYPKDEIPKTSRAAGAQSPKRNIPPHSAASKTA